MTERLHFIFSLSCIGEGNGNPLQYSCLETPMGRGVWRATVHGVAELDTTERLGTHTLWRQLGGPGWEYCVKATNAVVCA